MEPYIIRFLPVIERNEPKIYDPSGYFDPDTRDQPTIQMNAVGPSKTNGEWALQSDFEVPYDDELLADYYGHNSTAIPIRMRINYYAISCKYFCIDISRSNSNDLHVNLNWIVVKCIKDKNCAIKCLFCIIESALNRDLYNFAYICGEMHSQVAFCHMGDKIVRVGVDVENETHNVIARRFASTYLKCSIEVRAAKLLFRYAIQMRTFLKKRNAPKYIAYMIIAGIILENNYIDMQHSLVWLIMSSY